MDWCCWEVINSPLQLGCLGRESDGKAAYLSYQVNLFLFCTPFQYCVFIKKYMYSCSCRDVYVY